MANPIITTFNGVDITLEPHAGGNLDENTTLIGVFEATDGDGDTLTWSIVPGVGDAALVTIDPDTGELSFIAAPDFENPLDTVGPDNIYSVIVRVSDGTNTAEKTLFFGVNDVDGVTLTGTAGNDTLGPDDATPEDDILNGLAGNDILDGAGGADTMTGGTGNDTYYVDNAGDVVVELANQGVDLVISSVNHTLAAFVDNLTLVGTAISGTGHGGNNVITGNDEDNTLDGQGGADIIDGGAGADDMIGGAGDDTYYIDDAGDTVTELQNSGYDKVISSVNYTMEDFVDELTLTGTAISGTGNNLANKITGNDQNNTLSGLDGGDRLNGGNGTDTLIGGKGDDIYEVDTTTDTITELADEGNDTVQSSVNFSLALLTNIENLTLTDDAAITGTGNALNNVIRGSGSDNELFGLDGNDTLNGLAGADEMTGGLGNDIYVVDNVGDVAIESASQGRDKVITTVSYTLGTSIEDMTLGGSSAINGTGNNQHNFMTGNAANNTLTGLAGNDRLNGGGGNDTMIGGADDDTYTVNALGDTTVELAGQGTDTVKSSITWTLAANVENLTLTGLGTINGTGNELDNVMKGNIQANTLTGLAGNDTIDGKRGADTMVGGEGNDTYFVDNLGDVVTEISGQGTDLIKLSKSGYTMAANVENLEMLGKANLAATGNTGNNTMTGNTGANTIDGGDGIDTINGGSGNDTLLGGNGNDIIDGGAGGDKITGGAGADSMTGGSGTDTFIFTALTDSGTSAGVNTDMITDYATGEIIDLSAIDAITGGGTSNDTFVADTNGIFVAGEINVVTVGSVATVSLYTDNTAGADMVFQVTLGTGVTGLTFIL